MHLDGERHCESKYLAQEVSSQGSSRPLSPLRLFASAGVFNSKVTAVSCPDC